MPDIRDFQKMAAVLEASRRVLITTHQRPDGDACGCMRALAEFLSAHGARVELLVTTPLPDWYAELFSQKVWTVGRDVASENLPKQFQHIDLLVLVDTNSVSQLPGLEAFIQHIKRVGCPMIAVIDHHITGDGLGDVQLIDSNASAAGEVVYDLFKISDWTITPSIAEALFMAIASDTGWFKFGNADSRIFHTAAELIDIGAHPNEIYRRLYQRFTPQRMALMTRMLQRLQLLDSGRIAVQYLSDEDFQQTGATRADTENLIDECQRLATVEAAVLFVQQTDGRWRCSLRSKGKVDVRQIAQAYGGGGHTLAAAATMSGQLEALISQISAHIQRQLAQQGATDAGEPFCADRMPDKR